MRTPLAWIPFLLLWPLFCLFSLLFSFRAFLLSSLRFFLHFSCPSPYLLPWHYSVSSRPVLTLSCLFSSCYDPILFVLRWPSYFRPPITPLFLPSADPFCLFSLCSDPVLFVLWWPCTFRHPMTPFFFVFRWPCSFRPAMTLFFSSCHDPVLLAQRWPFLFLLVLWWHCSFCPVFKLFRLFS